MQHRIQEFFNTGEVELSTCMHTHMYTIKQHTHFTGLQYKREWLPFLRQNVWKKSLTADSAMQGTVYPSKLLYMPHILGVSDST